MLLVLRNAPLPANDDCLANLCTRYPCSENPCQGHRAVCNGTSLARTPGTKGCVYFDSSTLAAGDEKRKTNDYVFRKQRPCSVLHRVADLSTEWPKTGQQVHYLEREVVFIEAFDDRRVWFDGDAASCSVLYVLNHIRSYSPAITEKCITESQRRQQCCKSPL